MFSLLNNELFAKYKFDAIHTDGKVTNQALYSTEPAIFRCLYLPLAKLAKRNGQSS